MTDKQIIDLTEIDQKYKDKCSLIKAGKCKNVNIFIEQSRKLKAKEQECEKWKNAYEVKEDALTESEEYCEELEQQLDQLKAENEHLSEKEEEAKHYLEEAEKFKNCISEIKSLCYEQDLNEDFFACEVLQKISEVEDVSSNSQ